MIASAVLITGVRVACGEILDGSSPRCSAAMGTCHPSGWNIEAHVCCEKFKLPFDLPCRGARNRKGDHSSFVIRHWSLGPGHWFTTPTSPMICVRSMVDC